jgi:hypothetical protein
MIGWIALAGIIVRNSILLVDFSIHEVQKGVPVAEAVIRACKTRTRPILITALALVAGSSVIFFDQIFQGMAISLASGVLVSTVLTLIVIPLGCVAASKDLCEVAAATALPGVDVPCSTEEEKHAQKARSRPRGGGFIKVWGYVVEAFVLLFYAVRGIFLLLYDLVKNLLKKKQPPRSTPPRPAPSGGGGPASGGPPEGGGGGAPATAPAEKRASAQARPVEQTPAVAASPASGATAVVEGGSPPPKGLSAMPDREDEPEAPAKIGDPRAGTPEPGSPTSLAEQAKRIDAAAVETASVSATPALDDPGVSSSAPASGRNKTAAEQASGDKARAAKTSARRSSKNTGTRDVSGTAAATPSKKAVRKKAAGKKRAAKKAGVKASPPKPELVSKKAPRRGIRLKVDGGQGPGFD